MWDWGFENILPKEEFQKIKPYINSDYKTLFSQLSFQIPSLPKTYDELELDKWHKNIDERSVQSSAVHNITFDFFAQHSQQDQKQIEIEGVYMCFLIYFCGMFAIAIIFIAGNYLLEQF